MQAAFTLYQTSFSGSSPVSVYMYIPGKSVPLNVAIGVLLPPIYRKYVMLPLRQVIGQVDMVAGW